MSLVFLSMLISSLISLTNAAAVYRYHICSNGTTFTRNSDYQSNLNIVLYTLRSNTTEVDKFSYGFNNATAGQDTNKVYGGFLCRGDVSTKTCQDCVSVAASEVTQLCPLGKEAVIWYDECLLRYSNISFFSTMDLTPYVYLVNTQIDTVKDPLFAQKVANLMNEALNEAVYTPKMFATRESNYTAFLTLFGLVQCTPDLSTTLCSRCLREAISRLDLCCTGRQGARGLFPSCNIRYEMYPFYNDTSPAPEPATSQTPTPALLFPQSPGSELQSTGGKGNKVARIAIGTTVSTIIVSIMLGCFIWYTRRRNKGNEVLWRTLKKEGKKSKKLNAVCVSVAEKKANEEELRRIEGRIGDGYYSYDILGGETQGESHEFPVFPLGLVLDATQHFSDENKLGEGGFGPVYKGILADGKEIAVKRLSRTSGQGLQEFKNEVTLIAKLQHKNLVRLLGCCLEGNELLLIYEYMANRSLDFFLFGLPLNTFLTLAC